MREVKYKAYHKELKKVFFVETMKFLTYGSKDFQLELVEESFGEGGFRKPQETIECHISEVELMEYTSVNDKDGNDIYVGDIIKYTRLRTMMDGFITYTTVMPPLTDHNEYTVLKLHAKEIQKIGNIFENPELINS